jgi:hypothetical protein
MNSSFAQAFSAITPKKVTVIMRGPSRGSRSTSNLSNAAQKLLQKPVMSKCVPRRLCAIVAKILCQIVLSLAKRFVSIAAILVIN